MRLTATLLLGGLLLAGCMSAGGARRRAVNPADLPVQGLTTNGKLDVGPVARSAPAGAAQPRDEAELRAQLADPQGPKQIFLHAGTWHGDWTIRRSVHLLGAGPATRLQGSGTGTVLDIETTDAAVENLSMTGTGSRHTSEDAAVKARGKGIVLRRLDMDEVLFGASLASCTDCVVDRLHVRGRSADAELRGDGIKLWEASGSYVTHCLVEDVRDVVVWYSRRVQLAGNVVRGSRYGTHFMYAHDCSMKDSALINNTVGVFVMYSMRLSITGSVLAGAMGPAGVGLGFKDSDDVTVNGNWLIQNTVGAYFDATPRSEEHPVTMLDNVLALNEIGLRWHAQPHGVKLERNDLDNNAEVVEVDGGGDATTVAFRNNYWSDYAGYDLNGDGFGDVAHQQKHLSTALTDHQPALKLLRGTAALGTLDTLARAVPVLATKLMLQDPQPAMRALHVH